MSSPKTTVNDNSVEAFIKQIPDEGKRQDSFSLLEMFSRLTDETPKMWGSSIIGFGKYHYKSERSSQEGDWPLIGFSPRKLTLTLYVMSETVDHSDLLRVLGKHTTSKACLYIKKLTDINLDVLEKIVERSYQDAKKHLLS